VKYLCMASGGLVSAEAAHRIADRHGRDGLSLLFADTIVEDEDLYRFLIESSAVTLGVGLIDDVRHLATAASLIPKVEDDRMDDRKRELAWIRAEAQKLIPGLSWIADGRTPWEVFRDERFIGNSRVDPCSRMLKRELMDKFRDTNFDPVLTRIVVGLDWSERHRIEGDGKKKKGHRRLLVELGWTAEYPLNERPYLTRHDIEQAWEARGVTVGQSYALGFEHDNCGGCCVKMGLKQARHLLRSRSDRYLWNERQEQTVMAEIPTTKPFLRYRKGGATRRVSLRELRERSEEFPLLDQDDSCGACGCAIDVPEAEAIEVES
jgi:hypothetical protein